MCKEDVLLKCPCEECLKLAICRFRQYDETLNRCSDLKQYVLDKKDHRLRVKEFERVIRPVNWKLGAEQYNPDTSFIKYGYRVLIKVKGKWE